MDNSNSKKPKVIPAIISKPEIIDRSNEVMKIFDPTTGFPPKEITDLFTERGDD